MIAMRPNTLEPTTMPENEIPLRFEVSLNGERLSTGGAEYGLTFVSINHQRRHPEKDENPLIASSPNFDREEWLKEKIDMHFSASDSLSGNLMTWIERPLAVGDRIAIHLQGPGPIDPAIETRPRRTLRAPREPADAALLAETEEAYEAAVDELLDHMDMDDAALLAQAKKIMEAVNAYSAAAASVTEESVGNDWKVYHIAAKEMPQRASNIVSGVIRYRMRKAKRLLKS